MIDNEEFNEEIRSIADGDKFLVKGLGGTGKQIPYIGWYWRIIDFNSPNLPIGRIPKEEDSTGFVGFMANNKWCYPERNTTIEETEKIINMLKVIVEKPTHENLQELFDYFQTLM